MKGGERRERGGEGVSLMGEENLVEKVKGKKEREENESI